MPDYIFLILIIGVPLGVVFSVLMAIYGPQDGSWIKEDGTIVEWDGNGGGHILRPDGTLEKYTPDGRGGVTKEIFRSRNLVSRLRDPEKR